MKSQERGEGVDGREVGIHVSTLLYLKWTGTYSGPVAEVCLVMQGTQFHPWWRAWVPHARVATEPASQDYCAWAPRLERLRCSPRLPHEGDGGRALQLRTRPAKQRSQMGSQQGPVVQRRELCSVLGGSRDGENGYMYRNTWVHLSFAETIPTLLMGYTPI